MLHLGLELHSLFQLRLTLIRMSRRLRLMKRLLFRLLLTASLLVAPLLIWARMPLLHFVFSGEAERTEATDESIADDAEWEACLEEARINAASRTRIRRQNPQPWHVGRSAEWIRESRFALVVDIRRIKPKRLLAPPYLRPRVVRLLS